MSVTINAKGTSVPYFKLGKTGSTLYQGSSDPTGSYTVVNGDVWFDTSANTLKFRSSGSWANGIGTVTSVSVSGANGIGVSGSPVTSSGTISLSLGAITPTSAAIPANSFTVGTTQLVATSGSIGIGTASPATLLHLVGTGNVLRADTYGDSNLSPAFFSRKARGSVGSPTAVIADDILTGVFGMGYGTTGFGPNNTVAVMGLAAETFTDSTQATYLRFETTSTGSVTRAERMRIDSNGNVGVGTTTPDIFSRSYGGTILGISKASGQSAIVVNSNTGSAFLEMGVAGTRTGSLSASATNIELASAGALPILLATNSIERMRVDSSGNVGIGLTPVASNGILQLNSYASVKALLETATVTASAPASTTNFDLITQAVQYYTSNASTNFTLNIRGNSGTSLNTIMQTGQSATLSLLVTNGGTAYRPTAFQIDGNSVTPKWQGGTAPTAGNINSIDIYTLTIIKTASATFTVLATQTQFA